MSEDALVTPPVTPIDADDELLLNKGECNRLADTLWFDCLGEVNLNDHRLHPQSFLRSGEALIIEGNICSSQLANLRTVELFGVLYDEGSALYTHLGIFCQQVRKSLLMLESAAELNVKLKGLISTLTTMEIDYSHFRKQICELCAYIRKYVLCLLSNEDYVEISESLIPEIKKYLELFQITLGYISDLPEYITIYSPSTKGNKCYSAAYHLFHVHLDIKWYTLSIICLMEKCYSFVKSEDEYWREYIDKNIKYVIVDMVTLAVKLFEKTPIQDLKRKCIFNCTCVKEFWLLLQLLLDKTQDKLFWLWVNDVLNMLTPEENTNPSSEISCLHMCLPKHIPCNNVEGFSLWLMTHLTQLYGYDKYGKYLGHSSLRLQPNYAFLEKLLKVFGNPDNATKETHLRVYMQLVDLLLTWWPPRSEPLLVLWEYFHRKLNNSFFLPGATPDTMAITSKSSSGLLDQVNERISSSIKNMNSFDIFLHMLITHLKRCPDNWPQFRGRIYSKMSCSKLQGLNETGLYHLVTLFLIIAKLTDFRDISKQLQNFLAFLDMEKLESNRRIMIWQCHLALIQLHTENGCDIRSVAEPLLADVSKVCQNPTGNINLLRVFVEGIQDVINTSNTLQCSEYVLLGGWIQVYLSLCSESEVGKFLDVILNITDKLQNVLITDESQSIKLLESLKQHVLPFVENKFTSSGKLPPFQVADLAASFTLLAVEKPQLLSLVEMFHVFVTSITTNVRMTKRFLCHILQKDSILRELEISIPHYQSELIQVWIRCCLMSSDENQEELINLTRLICKLPDVLEICLKAGIDLTFAEEPLCTFVASVGNLYQNLENFTDKLTLREKCNSYFSSIEKCVAITLKNSAASNELVNRIYKVSAILVVQSGPLIYIKSKPNCLLPVLISQLILPHAVYNPETKLHPFIASALKKTIHHFIRGLFRLHPKTDPFITRLLRDIILQYFPRFHVSQNATSNVSNFLSSKGPASSHPFLNCFDDSRDAECGKFLLEILAQAFIKCRGSLPVSANTSLALSFVVSLLQQKHFSEDTMKLVLNSSFSNILEVAMFVEERNPVKKQVITVIEMVLSHAICKESSQLKQDFVSLFSKFSKQHMSFSSALYFKLLLFLCQLIPTYISHCLPNLKSIISHIESMRGSGMEHGLRRQLEIVENAIAK